MPTTIPLSRRLLLGAQGRQILQAALGRMLVLLVGGLWRRSKLKSTSEA